MTSKRWWKVWTLTSNCCHSDVAMMSNWCQYFHQNDVKFDVKCPHFSSTFWRQYYVKFWSNNWCDVNIFVNIWHQNWRQIWHQFWHQIDVILSTGWQPNDVKLTSNFGQIIDVSSIFSLTFDIKIYIKFDVNFDIKLTSSRRQDDDKMTSNWRQILVE